MAFALYIFLVTYAYMGGFYNAYSSLRFSRIRELSMSKEFDLVGHTERRIDKVRLAVVGGLVGRKGYACIDNFLGNDICAQLRDEAVHQFETDRMVLSKSTRYDKEINQVVEYDKTNVYSMQLSGGEQYHQAPLLTQYVVGLVGRMSHVVRTAFPDSRLSPTLASNKLAVCTGDGSSYDKHYDNSGGDDLRKLTCLYYINPGWREELGGSFRVHTTLQDFEDVKPIGDRLLVFWSDRLVHSVRKSFAPEGNADHRYALTVWLTTEDPGVIYDGEDVRQHFPDLHTVNSLNHY